MCSAHATDGTIAGLYQGNLQWPGARKQEDGRYGGIHGDPGVRPTSFTFPVCHRCSAPSFPISTPDLGPHRKTAGEATAASCTIAIGDSDSTAGSIFSWSPKGCPTVPPSRAATLADRRALESWKPGDAALNPVGPVGKGATRGRRGGCWRKVVVSRCNRASMALSRVLGAQLRNRKERHSPCAHQR